MMRNGINKIINPIREKNMSKIRFKLRFYNKCADSSMTHKKKFKVK